MRFGARATLIPGLVLAGAGLVLFRRAGVEADYVRDLLPVMLLLGVGAGLAFPALTSLAMSGATPSESGLASGLFQTTQQVGAALGLAVLATLATTRTGDLRAGGAPPDAALTGGYHLAFGIGALLVAAALVLAVTLLRTEAQTAPAENVAGARPAYSED
jgi:MFS family permease